MRKEDEIFTMLLDAARGDEKIRAVSLGGSRANPEAPKDNYQDYDITFYVTDMGPYYNNPEWVIQKFGRPLVMQMPEAMRYPSGGGHFNYMMIYPDGVRIDLTFEFRKYVVSGEPELILLDKDKGAGFVPPLPPPNDAVYHIKPPSPLFFYSCCNNFWWCLNNAAKGIARDELPYVMYMLNLVREELHDMIDWFIGVTRGFSLSTGKYGKYFKRYLSPDLYERYAGTYSGGDYGDIWAALYTMCDLFHDLALPVAGHFAFVYRRDEEAGIREYLRMVRNGEIL